MSGKCAGFLRGVTAGIVLAVALIAGQSPARATLTTAFQFNGAGNWSIDGCGSFQTDPVCDIQAIVPAGSTVEAAFLYSSLFATSAIPTPPVVVFGGTTYDAADWTDLGRTTGASLQAFRADVTEQVAATIGGGSSSPFTFTIQSEGADNVDGEALAIVYGNPGEQVRTIAFLDGASAQAGDSFTVNLGEPLDTSATGFQVLLSLGIGFSIQPGFGNQVSLVDVNGQRLTSCAGGSDDGLLANGALITVGGLGDSPANPDPNCTDASGPRGDDELYDLATAAGPDGTALLADGDTRIDVATRNRSFNDNIFFAGLNLTARAGVNAPPPPPPPSVISEPESAIIFGIGLIILGAAARRIGR